MKQSIIVNGKTYEIEFSDVMTSPVEVTVNGKKYSVTIEGEPVTPSMPPKATPTTSAPVAKPNTVPAKVAKPAATAAVTSSADEVRAPMPGVILDVEVKAGDQVTVGQVLCTLEAMKMKNAIRSPREGTILSVEVSDGQKVAYGDVLVRFA